MKCLRLGLLSSSSENVVVVVAYFTFFHVPRARRGLISDNWRWIELEEGSVGDCRRAESTPPIWRRARRRRRLAPETAERETRDVDDSRYRGRRTANASTQSKRAKSRLTAHCSQASKANSSWLAPALYFFTTRFRSPTMQSNPRRACAARVTALGLCVCVSVCLSVCLSACLSVSILALQATTQLMSDTNSCSTTSARKLNKRFC